MVTCSGRTYGQSYARVTSTENWPKLTCEQLCQSMLHRGLVLQMLSAQMAEAYGHGCARSEGFVAETCGRECPKGMHCLGLFSRAQEACSLLVEASVEVSPRVSSAESEGDYGRR